jgi:hypothetical protein
MTLFEYDHRLAPVRTGRYAEATTVFVWLAALAATALTPAGLAVAAVLFGLSANSVSRAFAAAGTFSIVVVGTGYLSMLLFDALPVLLPAAFGAPVVGLALFALFVPPVGAAVVRAIG